MDSILSMVFGAHDLAALICAAGMGWDLQYVLAAFALAMDAPVYPGMVLPGPRRCSSTILRILFPWEDAACLSTACLFTRNYN
jgi:hypothetical protein